MFMDFGRAYENATVTHSDLTTFRIDSTIMGVDELTVTAIVASLIILVSLVVLLAGQKLVKTAVLITLSLMGFLGFFVLIHLSVASTTDATTGFYPCVFPFVMAIVCALLLDVIALVLINRFVWAPNFIFGAAATMAVALVLRENLQRATQQAGDHALVELSFFDTWYWLIAAAATVLVGLLATVLATSDGRKSAVVIGVTCVVGAYGLTLGITALVNLYHEKAMPAWSFWAIAAPVALVGLGVQFFLTGTHAAAHREATRQRIRSVSRRGARNPKEVPGVQVHKGGAV